MRFFIILIIVLEKISLINQNKPNDGITFEATETIVFYPNNTKSIKIICPMYHSLEAVDKSTKCIECNENSQNVMEECSGCRFICLPDFENILNIFDHVFHYEKCEFGSIYRYHSFNPVQFECYKPNCPLQDYYDFTSNRCIKCSELIDNSIGRIEGSLPLYKYCSCKNEYIKVIENDYIIKCISSGQIYDDVINKIQDFQIKSGYFEIRSNQSIYYILMICHPHKRLIIYDHYCICNYGFLYHDGICQSCADLKLKNINLDECICSEGFEKNIGGCKKCSKGYYKDTIGDGKCKKCNLLYTTKYIGSIHKNSCSILNIKVIIIFVTFGLIILAIIISLSLVYCMKKRKVLKN